jgi:glycosyltransferase involved in cell wall biosynthesis
MTAVEAMMVGLPVVASRVGGLPEVLGAEGILVPPGDPVALAAGIRAALALSPEVHARGQMRVRAEFSVERMADGAEAVYAATLRTRSAHSGP